LFVTDGRYSTSGQQEKGQTDGNSFFHFLIFKGLKIKKYIKDIEIIKVFDNGCEFVVFISPPVIR
jgi:hypothetical protein